MNWRGRPLTSHEVIVNTIAATTTRTGLTVHAELDPGSYPAGEKISDEQMNALPLTRHRWHGDWNYTLDPHPLPPAASGLAPAPAPAPVTRPLRCGHDTLTHPALTGLPRPELDDLAARLALAWNAQLEAQRYAWRRGPRRQASGPLGSLRLDLTSQIALTLIHQRLSVPRHVLAWLTGTHPDTVSRAIKTISPLLSQPAPPGPARLRTPADLIRYAARANLTIPAET
jgi:hypothetical protein